MDMKELKSLIKMVIETDITEFELEVKDEKIRIKRGTTVATVQLPAQQQVFAMPSVSQPTAPATPAPAAASAPQKGEAVTSPIVGTFYRAPSPDSAPYVEVGQVVEKGQILCIVEAMKLMNEIEAEFRCKILEICKENAQPVEYGDALFIVEKI